MASRSSGFLNLTAILALAAVLGGCAFGRTYSYSAAAINLPGPSASATALTVGVQDRRTYVVSGGKPERFVGLMRGGFGNPFDVNTRSGGPLADEVRDALTKSLKGKGYSVTSVGLSPSDSKSVVRRKLSESGGKKIALVTLTEWKADTMRNTDLHYDVTLAILNGQGEQLATNTVKGKDSLGRPEGTGLADAFARKIESLFDDEKIIAALK